MSSLLAQSEPLAVAVSFPENMLCVQVQDGRELSVPLEWFPRLRNATSEQLKKWRLQGNSEGIHWDDLDEDISVLALFGLPD